MRLPLSIALPAAALAAGLGATFLPAVPADPGRDATGADREGTRLLPELPRRDPAPREAPPESRAPEALGSFDLTYYWMAFQGPKPADKRPVTIYAPTCEPLAEVSDQFARRLAMEGTGRLRDGRVVNAAGRCGCSRSPCFLPAAKQARWGLGAGQRPLSPFRSVAVDPVLVPLGQTLYVPELDGLTMPGRPPWGGFVHDGCVVAEDRGGGVEGAKLDLFTGQKSHYRALFRRHGIDRVSVFPGETICEADRPSREPAARRGASST